MSGSTRILLVLVGVYASGKTTLANTLSTAYGFTFFHEIGGALRSRSKCVASQSCSIFDELVMFREIERDNQIALASRSANIVLEQWHIGNIAYARIRNPLVADEYLARISKQGSIQQLTPRVVVLDFDPALISSRISYTSEDSRLIDERFFIQWKRELAWVLERLELPAVHIDANQASAKILVDLKLHIDLI